MASNAIDLNDENFKDYTNSDKPVLADLGRMVVLAKC